ncbi:sensor histidine kinase [Pseudarthrobacter sp. J1763]|uniref:sensor histidine kinase n=1 Tax=Pseudarthrobacter sp. J1763 TaxID=3420445 RepID=UPI003D2A5192
MDRRHTIYQWFRDNPFKVDLGAAILLCLPFGALYAVAGALPESLISTTMILTIAWRRTRPELAAGALVILCLIHMVIPTAVVAGILAVPVIIYSTAAYGAVWASRSVLVAGLIGAVMIVVRLNNSETSSTLLLGLTVGALYVILVSLLVLFSWTLGDLTRTRRLQVQALEDRARRLEIEQHQERALAAMDERSHIAREMHDIIAHSLSVIITQADGARYAAVADPAVAPATLETIAATGRGSLAEMRRLLGILRNDGDTPTRPLPGLADLDELLLGVRAAGLPLSFEQSGTPRAELPAGAELTAYRIVQEALTNVLKHAGPSAKATARLDWTAKGLDLRVQDNGFGSAASSPAPTGSNGGNGLRGMQERVKLYDGQLTAGPHTGGGFLVTAHIPYSEA